MTRSFGRLQRVITCNSQYTICRRSAALRNPGSGANVFLYVQVHASMFRAYFKSGDEISGVNNVSH